MASRSEARLNAALRTLATTDDQKQAAETANYLEMRALQLGDFDKGYMKLLEQLTVVGDVSKDVYEARFNEMASLPDTYFTIVFEDTSKSKIVATAALTIERKFIRGCGKIGHIEDVVVDKQYRGFRLAVRLLEALKQIAKDCGCYKVILDCTEAKIAFYEKLGFQKKEQQMALYF